MISRIFSGTDGFRGLSFLPAGEKVGADDYIAQNGPHAFLKLMWSSCAAEREVDAM